MKVRTVLVALAIPLAAAAQPNPLTARQVIERIQKNVGVPWKAETVDTFKAGDPDTPVTGIATTMMATYDVLRRAAASGKNLIITHEPTFYAHLDTPEGLPENDPVWAEKRAFIEKLEAQAGPSRPLYSLFSQAVDKPPSLEEEFELFRVLYNAARTYDLNTTLQRDPRIHDKREAVETTLALIARTVEREPHPIRLTLDTYGDYLA